ncbi:HEAT repeat domain-containing protein [Streptomyces zhihengii]
MTEDQSAAGSAVRRLVLRDEVSIDELRRRAETLGWRYAGMIDRDPDQRIYREMKWFAADDVAVHYVEDEFADERFLMAAGGNLEERNAVLGSIPGRVPVWSLEDLMYAVSSAAYPAGRARAVMRLGVGSPLNAYPPVVTRIERAAKDPDIRVRKSAVWAMAYSDWPEYRDVLENVAAHDADSQIAHSASLIVQRLGESE